MKNEKQGDENSSGSSFKITEPNTSDAAIDVAALATQAKQFEWSYADMEGERQSVRTHAQEVMERLQEIGDHRMTPELRGLVDELSQAVEEIDAEAVDSLDFERYLKLTEQFSDLVTVLSVIKPDYVLFSQVSPVNLIKEIMTARPEWFDQDVASASFTETSKEFWRILNKKGITQRDRITLSDVEDYARTHPRHSKVGIKLSALREWLKERGHLPDRVQTLPLSAHLRFTNDAIHAGTVRAFSQASQWSAVEGLDCGFLHTQKGGVKVAVGFGSKSETDRIWAFLCRGGPRMVKAHYALWARYYEATEDGLKTRHIPYSVVQFCDDVGFKKHKNGGYRPEQKRDAMKMLEALTTAKIRVSFALRGKGSKKEVHRMTGALWARGMDHEVSDDYEDSMGQTRQGNPEQWDPRTFTYAPGPWYDDELWRKRNKYIGKIGIGLMQLPADDENKWAILIGGYLGTLARANAYKPLRLRVGTILANAGLAQSKDAIQKVSQNRERFYTAFEKLQAVGVIASSRTEGFDESDVKDLDDAEALAEYSNKQIYPEGDWRSLMIEITWPLENDAKRLADAKDLGIKESVAKNRKRGEIQGSQKAVPEPPLHPSLPFETPPSAGSEPPDDEV